MNMKIAVTGGAGFIGSNLVRRLLDNGHDVVIIDDFSRGTILNLKDLQIQTEVRRLDLRNFSAAVQGLRGAETVYHLAARVGGISYLHGSEQRELEALQSNLAIDANVFRACIQLGVPRLVYGSSVAVYPVEMQNRDGVVLDESALTRHNPEGGYGWAKLLGEMQLSWIGGMKIGIARLFNIYGENSEAGASAHVVTSLIRKAVRYPAEGYTVWGDSTKTRDFLYVGDCVSALVKLQESLEQRPLIVNVGSDESVSIKVLAEKIAAISGKPIKIIYDQSRPSGPRSRTCNNQYARELLDWTPQVSFDEGLQQTYRWAEKRLESTGEC
ncbi:MAG TPA: NAD-dependent epimerase/dehydratase family protein [Dehalococcoidales bacterium]|nr:NAD-dependent epimerase/dehydratase family protein [Dehalococcoidales bacterium]